MICLLSHKNNHQETSMLCSGITEKKSQWYIFSCCLQAWRWWNKFLFNKLTSQSLKFSVLKTQQTIKEKCFFGHVHLTNHQTQHWLASNQKKTLFSVSASAKFITCITSSFILFYFLIWNFICPHQPLNYRSTLFLISRKKVLLFYDKS